MVFLAVPFFTAADADDADDGSRLLSDLAKREVVAASIFYFY